MRRFLLRVWRWLRAEIVFGFLIATVFGAGVLGWQAAYAPTDAEKQKCYDAAERTGHKTEECKTLWERTTSDPVAFFTFWLVVSTIGLGISTVMLWLAGEKQFRHARRTSIIQSRDMRESIAAANRSAAAAERALTDLERPWIFVFGISRPIQDGTDFRVDYKVANFGKIPAIIEEARAGLVFSDASGDPQTPLFVSDDHSLTISPVLKPGDERDLSDYFPLSETFDARFQVINAGTDSEDLMPVPVVDLEPNQSMFFRVLINYRGPASRGHETSANWLYRDPWDFVRRGDEYN
jgi:hypothetical protein